MQILHEVLQPFV
jgi:hypothetical protein